MANKKSQPVQLPPGMQRGLYAQTTPERTIKLHVIRGGQSVECVEMGADSASQVVIQLLACIFNVTPHPLPPLPRDEDYTGPVLPLSAIALGQNRSPKHETLSVRVGAALLAFPISHADLEGLGRAMLAASAQPAAKN